MIRQASLIVGLLIAGLCGVFASAQPDLVITDIATVPATPIAGEPTLIQATIENVGSQGTGLPFYVTFEVDGREIDAILVSRILGTRDSTTAAASWTAVAGPHTLRVLADDPFNRVAEIDEQNNDTSQSIQVTLSSVATATLSPFKIAVARFDDASGSSFVNVGEGVADKLVERLVAAGVRVLERSELEAILQEHSLNPALSSDVALAGQMLGADLMVVGSVTDVDVQQVSFRLGFLSMNSAAVDVRLSARLVSVATSEVVSAFSAEGHDEGSTGFSIDIGQILGYLQSVSPPLCAPGFLTDESSYGMGESVALSYQNPGASAWFGVEIYTATGTFLKWLGWEFVDTGTCANWVWNQRNAADIQMSPGIYTAKLWDGASYIATVDFQILPGLSLIMPSVDEITVGTQQFSDTVVGAALDQALDHLTSTIIAEMEQAAPLLLAQQAELPEDSLAMGGEQPIGQVAAILPDGRLAINAGASDGVTRGDFFEVLETANVVVDPQTQEILAYDVLSVRGEAVITEIRDLVSYAVPTSEFTAEIGDIVRLSAP